MDCRLIQGELLPYALGTSSQSQEEGAESERIDEHLVACTNCLRAYLRLKHHVERGGPLAARPSEETRRRIRADVAALVRPSAPARVRQWLRRPIPLYQGLAVAAVAAGVAIGGPQMLEALARKPAETMAHVDMSRPVPQARAIY